MTFSEQAREVIRWCRRLAAFSEDRESISRRCLSAPMREVHTALAAWMARAGMTVRVDAIGNLRGVYPPAVAARTGAGAARLYLGSHLDTVPNAGAFDGVLGVVMAVAVVELLAERRFPFAIEVIGFSDEEGVRFGAPFLGSRAVAGTFDAGLLDRKDPSGRTLQEAIRQFGLDPSRLADAAAPADAVGYLEFHIEQGPVLENLNLPLAIVDAISGQSRVYAAFTGSAAHAGTTPMRLRKDALATAAAWICEIEREALTTPGLVATAGRIAARPGAVNVIAGEAEVSLDLRHPEDAVRHAALQRLTNAAREMAARRGVAVAFEAQLDQPSVAMSPPIVGQLERVFDGHGHPAHKMPSGAGHDAMVMAARMPAGMVFLRCTGGISHHPDENVREDDVAAALEIGVGFVTAMGASSRA